MTLKSLNIITALNCEAKPLIDYYRLTKVQARPYDYYKGVVNSDTKLESESDDCLINLVVCGIGKQNIATACGWLAAKTDQFDCAWLNIGTAGHKHLQTTDIVRVHRVVDMFTGSSHYPAMTAKWSGLSSTLITYETACSDYPQDALVDMEGAAFFSSAGMFASNELVQSLKIVSDNESDSLERLNASLISQLIQPHMSVINSFVLQLLELIQIKPKFDDHLALIGKLRSTVSQRQQYIDLLSKLHSLQLLDEPLLKKVGMTKSTSKLLEMLRNSLDGAQPSLQQMVE